MTVKNLALLFVIFSANVSSVLAVDPRDIKTCIEGTDFDIKRVRQLVIEGREVKGYTDWETKKIPFSGAEITNAHSNWFRTVFFKKYRSNAGTRRKTVYSLHIKNTPEIIAQVREAIASKTGARLDNIHESVSIPYRGEGRMTESGSTEVRRWDRYVFTYQYRADDPKFKITREDWSILNMRSQNVIEAACRVVNRVCLDATNKVFLGKYQVERPCWKEEVTYNCHTEPVDGCRTLVNQGYILYKNECLDQRDALCFKWKRYYMRHQVASEHDENNANSNASGYGKDDAENNRAEDEEGGRQRIFGFPRRQPNDASQERQGDRGNSISNRNAKSGTQSKNNVFQKHQSIPTKGTGTGLGSSNISSTSARSSASNNQSNNKNEAVIAESIQIDPDFLLQEGTYIPCSLMTRFVSEVAGKIQCMVNQDIYSASGRVKLIERGTKAIGTYQSGTLEHGRGRMHVIWTKLLTPDHKRVNLVDTHVVGRLGEAGIDGRVDSHFMQRFGGALMISFIQDVVSHATEKHANHSKRNTININSYEKTRDGMTNVVEKMLESSVGIPPTMYKKQGDIVGIEVGKDIDFSKIYKIRIKL